MRFFERAVAQGSYSLHQPLWVCRCGIEQMVRSHAANGEGTAIMARSGSLKLASLRELRQTLVHVRQRASLQREHTLNVRDRTRALAASISSQQVGTIAIDGRARHLAANAAACAITGYSETELRGMTVWRLVADAQIRQGKRGWSRFLRDGHFEGTCRLLHKSGDVITIRYVAAAHVLRGVHVSAMALRRSAVQVRRVQDAAKRA